MRERLAFLFGMNGSVGRAEYLRTGLVLALLKYAGDNAILYAFTRQLMSPLRYSMMSLSLALPQRRLELGLIFAMALWSLPFLWIGMAMTLRRCADAGMRTRLSLLFLVPIVNYFLIVALCVAESSELPERIEPQRFLGTRRRALLLGVMSGIAVLVVSTGLSVFALHVYGAALFIGAPFVSGFVAAHVLTRGWPQATGRECAGVAVASVVGAGAALLLISWEGVMCLVMALPLAALVAMLGSAMGHWTALGSGHASPALVLLLAWPLLTAVEAHESSAPIRVVLSTIEVDRPVDRVWPHVIAFPELPPPHEWYFRNGIAYPVRARIRGQGAGAIRYCEFSTGPFVEPITTWDAPYRLAFDVSAQPRPMTELSPYQEVYAPHLDGNLKSRRGEFHLVPLPGGRTRIEARTWYSIDMYPQPYWSAWSDAIIHAIHMRVLRHVAQQAES